MWGHLSLTIVTFSGKICTWNSFPKFLARMKSRAVDAYEYGTGENRYFDKVSKIDYLYGETIVLTLHRWTEYLGYNPAE